MDLKDEAERERLFENATRFIRGNFFNVLREERSEETPQIAESGEPRAARRKRVRLEQKSTDKKRKACGESSMLTFTTTKE